MERFGWKESGTTMFQSPARQWWGRRFRLPGPFAVFAFAGLLLAQGPATFTSDVNLVRVTATVKNPAGAHVGALQQSDFTVLDNGVRQEIAVFERKTEVPLSVILLVDTSGSTAKDLKYET